MKQKKLIFFIFTFIFNLCCAEIKKCDMIIFSFNRPLQLYALLESIEELVTDIGDMCIIYRTTGERYDAAYEQIKQRFPHACYIRQGKNPYGDFKPLLLRTFAATKNSHIIFATDDIIVKDHISLSDAIRLLDQYDAYGFYFRLGTHLTHCYSMNSMQHLPSFTQVAPGVFSWILSHGHHDWGYPNTVDMTLYRKKDIENDMRTENYKAPNSFEAAWAGKAHAVRNRIGLCYECTKIINIPLNSVQSEWTNRNMNALTAEQALELFFAGQKIDRAPLFKMINVAAHTPCQLTFMNR